jgi:hypothetical protein
MWQVRLDLSLRKKLHKSLRERFPMLVGNGIKRFISGLQDCKVDYLLKKG